MDMGTDLARDTATDMATDTDTGMVTARPTMTLIKGARRDRSAPAVGDVAGLEALRDTVSLVAVIAAVVLVFLVGFETHRALQVFVWLAFVVDLLVLRLTCRRLRRRAVKAQPGRLVWGHPPPLTAVYGV